MTLNTTYFGSVDWYARLANATEPVFIDASERFVKQTERSRCRIATANGVQTLSVPVKSLKPSEPLKPLVTDILISDHANWRHLHWNALCSAYGESPFFDYYADDIRPFFEPDWTNLFDYNLSIINKVCELLGIEPPHVGMEPGQPAMPMPPVSTPPYYQTFQRRHGFIPNLSILDLLFNTGNEAILYLLRRQK